MLEVQMEVLRLWFVVGQRMRAAAARASDKRDRGEVTATTALIVILVIAAIAAAGVIAERITSNADNVPSPSP